MSPERAIAVLAAAEKRAKAQAAAAKAAKRKLELDQAAAAQAAKRKLALDAKNKVGMRLVNSMLTMQYTVLFRVSVLFRLSVVHKGL